MSTRMDARRAGGPISTPRVVAAAVRAVGAAWCRLSGVVGAVVANRLLRRPRAPDHGSGTALVAAVIVIGMLIASVAVMVGAYVMAANRARDTADLAALSAGAAAAAQSDPCAAARQAANDNDVLLTACTTVGDSLDFVVSVSVTVPIRMPGLPGSTAATANAGWLGR